jgi:hypothetical protein
MDDYLVYDTVSAVNLELGDQIVYVDDEGDVHYIEVYDLDDDGLFVVGSGYCHEDDDNHCVFVFTPFEGVELWTRT